MTTDVAGRPTWVLLHGTPMTPAVWDDVAVVLATAGPVAAPDLSHRVGEPADQTSHAHRLLGELAGTGPLHVVGHSFGGQVAIELAIAAPDRVRSLAIVCSRDTPFRAFAQAASTLRASPRIDPDPTLARWFTASQLRADGAVVRYARTCLLDADPVAWADDLDAIATYDRSDAVAHLTMPMTLIAAHDDRVATVAAMTALADRAADATLHVVDGSHLSPFTDPDDLGRRLLAGVPA
jgi:pimeloyl-ACP methyl ester carboxylesterase